MILIYSEELTPRFEYISKLIFEDILNVSISFTSNSSEFRKSELPKINYSYEKFDDELYLKPHRILFSRALIYPDFGSVPYNGQKYFFETSKDSFLPFDPLAASFFVVTRLEEYLEKHKGKYSRYSSSQSILFKYNLLEKPVVNIWAAILAQKIKERYPAIEFPKRKFQFISTIDIDNAWAYSNKGLIRNTGALIKGLVKNRPGNSERLKVWFKTKKDPYDTYDYMNNVFKGKEKNVIFFFLLGDYSKYDKNISHNNKNLRKLIQSISARYTIGIHPSYSSSRKGKSYKIGKEVNRLRKITGKEITKSRQHYLRLSFPKTYRRLIKQGISEDYTMGYAARVGFRAGICTPFLFYDLKKDRVTNLKAYPFQVMDVTLKNYLSLNPEEAKKTIERLILEVKSVGGTFISIWHNETLNGQGDWAGYKEVFEYMNELGVKLENE